MLSIVRGCTLFGVTGSIIEVEVDFDPRATLPKFHIVGLPDTTVRESEKRVTTAIRNSGSQFPQKKYVVNLYPASSPKNGTSLDLAMAVGVLGATNQAPPEKIDGAVFIGELSLDGSVRPVGGILPMVYQAVQSGFKTAYVPIENAKEAALAQGITIYPVESLGVLIEHFYEMKPIEPYPNDLTQSLDEQVITVITDFADIRGQESVKRAMEVAVAGNHNILLTGPPGSGKSLISRATMGILPKLTIEEALEITQIYSAADKVDKANPLIRTRPFRAPHHTTSAPALVGGTALLKPGEISLAHRGVLFLDEILEFHKESLNLLRQPLEDKFISIGRARASATFPTNFMLIAARNPCPCGYYGDTKHICKCTPNAIQNYQNRLSGPMMDRIDIFVEVQRVDDDKLTRAVKGESSVTIRERIEMARAIQWERYQKYGHIYTNADMPLGDIAQMCVMTDNAKQLLDMSLKRLGLSARAYQRVTKLSRTIADLAGSDMIQIEHVAEAVQYRQRNEAMP